MPQLENGGYYYQDDDGSGYSIAPDGDQAYWNTNNQLISTTEQGVTNFTPVYYTDRAEASRLQQFAAAPSGIAWYEQVAQYGLMRAIDTHYGVQQNNVPRGALAATFAGQNGRTYTQGAVDRTQTGNGGSMGGMLPLLIIGLAALAMMT